MKGVAMKSLIAKKPGVAEYTELYERPVPAEDQVLLKVLRNGICATDMAILSGKAGFMNDGSTQYPVRFGHEFVGEIVEVGSKVQNFKVGERAICEGYVSCNECEECKKGMPERCKNIMGVGTLNTWPGSYAEYVLFPERHLIKIPESLTNDEAALIEPAAVGMDGVMKAKIVPGESMVLVVGVGAIGIAAAALAKHYGAKKVMISGRTPYKLEIAKKMGVDAVCNPKEESLVEFVKRETNGHGVDSVIECSGSIEVLDECVEVLAEQGRLVIVAFYEQLYKTFDIDKFVMKNCVLESVMFHAFDEVIKAMQEGVDLTPLITRHVKFDECGAFMTKLIETRSKEDIKIMVDFE